MEHRGRRFDSQGFINKARSSRRSQAEGAQLKVALRRKADQLSAATRAAEEACEAAVCRAESAERKLHQRELQVAA